MKFVGPLTSGIAGRNCIIDLKTDFAKQGIPNISDENLILKIFSVCIKYGNWIVRKQDRIHDNACRGRLGRGSNELSRGSNELDSDMLKYKFSFPYSMIVYERH